MRLLVSTAWMGLLSPSGLAQARLKNPTDWKWQLDTPATLVERLDPPAGSWLFVRMPPGWHVTTGPGALLYPAELPEVQGNFSIEAQVFLFPGKNQEEYGVFIGGQAFEKEAIEYTSLVIRRDGQAAALVCTRAGANPAVPWRRHDAIAAHAGGDDPVKNVLRADVDRGAVSLSVNGVKVFDVPPPKIRTAGRVGLRIGRDLNLHITNFDITRRLAPLRADR